MTKWLIGLSIVVAIGLVALGVGARATQTATEPPQLISMADSAAAMQRTGALMQPQGQEIVAGGQRNGDTEIANIGQSWMSEGQALVQGGRWMAMDPTAPANLAQTPAALASEGNWQLLTRGAQAMVHDPRTASQINLQALAWDGMQMRSEGRSMADHGTVMLTRVDAMIVRHPLPAQTIADLRDAARTLQDAGTRLDKNGQGMLDFAARLHG